MYSIYFRLHEEDEDIPQSVPARRFFKERRQSPHNQRETGLESRNENHFPEGGRSDAQQDPGRHRLHHSGSATRLPQEGRLRPSIHS